MINHVSTGVRDIPGAKSFYDAVFKPLGYRCLSSSETSLGYGKDRVELWLGVSKRPAKPDIESGLHFCFDAPTRKSVDAFHQAGLAAGGRDNGKPRLRDDYGADYYSAYIIDPDGYRIEAYCNRAA